ncbi:MAG: PilZ domain-containing protein [Pseudomonadales bacterium]|nr:PilZ domain-containing protein [Pseudomonadales bacterium]
MRENIRYSTQVPINVHVAKQVAIKNSELINLSVGGLCCESEKFIAVGTIINIDIPLSQPSFQGVGKVAWCRETVEGGFELGVHFVDDLKEFRTLMVDQVHEIESYKQRIWSQEGRDLNSEEAAREWIVKYAEEYGREHHV